VTQILDEKNQGSTIGESLFFTDGDYPYNCCAVEDTTVATVPLTVSKFIYLFIYLFDCLFIIYLFIIYYFIV